MGRLGIDIKLVNDLAPVLGGNLDANGFSISNVGALDMNSNNITDVGTIAAEEWKIN